VRCYQRIFLLQSHQEIFLLRANERSFLVRCHQRIFLLQSHQEIFWLRAHQRILMIIHDSRATRFMKWDGGTICMPSRIIGSICSFFITNMDAGINRFLTLPALESINNIFRHQSKMPVNHNLNIASNLILV
jgi:hypothetical protein